MGKGKGGGGGLVAPQHYDRPISAQEQGLYNYQGQQMNTSQGIADQQRAEANRAMSQYHNEFDSVNDGWYDPATQSRETGYMRPPDRYAPQGKGGGGDRFEREAATPKYERPKEPEKKMDDGKQNPIGLFVDAMNNDVAPMYQQTGKYGSAAGGFSNGFRNGLRRQEAAKPVGKGK